MTIKSESNWRGYCAKCDTVWEQGEKCRCEMISKPISYSGTLDSFDRAKVGYDKMDEHEKSIWNAAIEAALYEIDDSELYCIVARLKK